MALRLVIIRALSTQCHQPGASFTSSLAAVGLGVLEPHDGARLWLCILCILCVSPSRPFSELPSRSNLVKMIGTIQSGHVEVMQAVTISGFLFDVSTPRATGLFC